MQHWTVSIPIEGFFPTITKDYTAGFQIEIDGVIFHFRNERLMGTVTIEANENEVHTKAFDLVNKAVTALCYIYKQDFKVVKNGYNYRKQSESSTSETIVKSLIVKYRIGIEKNFKETLSKIKSIKAEKKESLSKALGYFRTAQTSDNAFQAIETYFSCITAIVRENVGVKDVKQCHLRHALKSIVQQEKGKQFDENLFDTRFDTLYGKRRSSSAHGHIDIMNETDIKQVKDDAEQLRQWTMKLIDNYMDRNQNL